MNIPEPDKHRCTIYLLRHGDSRQDTIRRLIGRTDESLNEMGRTQAEWWFRKFARISFNHCYCSNLMRSVETAQIIVGHRPEIPFTILPQLGEIDLGHWDGMPVSDVRRLFSQEYELRGADLEHYRPPEAESFADLAVRVLPAFEEVVQQSAKNVLIVGHAGVNRTILCRLLGIPLANLFRLGQDYGCLNILEYSDGVWVVRMLNFPAGTNDDFQLA